jgi:hypothetical protein
MTLVSVPLIASKTMFFGTFPMLVTQHPSYHASLQPLVQKNIKYKMFLTLIPGMYPMCFLMSFNIVSNALNL